MLRAAEELADAAEVALDDYGDDALHALHRALHDFRRAQQRELAARIEMHLAMMRLRGARVPSREKGG